MGSLKSNPGLAEARVPLGYLLRQAAGRHRLKVDRALAELHVTAPQLLILSLVESAPGCSSADLARRSLLTAATVSIVVNRLVKNGALVRVGHGSHGRIKLLRLSDSGRALLENCQRAVVPVERQLRDGLDPSSERIVRAWLGRALAG